MRCTPASPRRVVVDPIWAAARWYTASNEGGQPASAAYTGVPERRRLHSRPTQSTVGDHSGSHTKSGTTLNESGSGFGQATAASQVRSLNPTPWRTEDGFCLLFGCESV